MGKNQHVVMHEKAKAIARRERSEAVLHGKDGRIRERNTYGADPRSSKG